MAKWKKLFRHVTANVNSGGDATRGGNQTENGAKSLLQADDSHAKPDEKIEFALSFVDTLSALETSLHTSDDPEEIAQGAMRVACDFYEADWCGFLTVDLDLGLWTPYWWYNTQPSDRTTEITNEFESAAKLDRWIAAMRNNDKV